MKTGSMRILHSSNVNQATKHLQDLRDNLIAVDGYGYIAVTNIIHLSSLCGILPAIAYTLTDLPKSSSSGSNKFMKRHMKENNNGNLVKGKLFKECVYQIQKCTSSRIFSSDVENVMCELDREERNCRKVECIFWDKSSNTIQDIFRIHKTNITRHSCVMKYQVQVLHKHKWYCVDKDISPMYEEWDVGTKNRKEGTISIIGLGQAFAL